jgi:hypothetical protein
MPANVTTGEPASILGFAARDPGIPEGDHDSTLSLLGRERPAFPEKQFLSLADRLPLQSTTMQELAGRCESNWTQDTGVTR